MQPLPQDMPSKVIIVKPHGAPSASATASATAYDYKSAAAEVVAPTTIISKGGQKECYAVVTLVNDAFNAAYDFRSKDYLSPMDYIASLKNPHETWYLLKVNNGATEKIVSVVKHVIIDKDTCELKILATHVKEKRKKYGEMLIKEVESRTPCKVVKISCVYDPNNLKLVKYYQKLGYVLTEQRFKFDNAYLKPEFHDKIECCILTKTLNKK